MKALTVYERKINHTMSKTERISQSYYPKNEEDEDNYDDDFYEVEDEDDEDNDDGNDNGERKYNYNNLNNTNMVTNDSYEEEEYDEIIEKEEYDEDEYDEEYDESYYVPKTYNRSNPDTSERNYTYTTPNYKLSDNNNNKLDVVVDEDDGEGDSPTTTQTVYTNTSYKTSETYNSELINLCEESDWIGLQAFLTYASSSDMLQDSNIIGPNGMTVLHLACYRGAPLNIIESLIDGNANGVSSCDDYGNLPIHYVVSTKRGVDDCEEYDDNYYNENDEEDGNNNAINTVEDEIIEILLLLLQHFPDSISHKNNKGYTPLHSFFSNDNTTDNDDNKDVNDDDTYYMFNDNFSASSVLDITKVLLDILPTQQSSAVSNKQDNTQEDDNNNDSTDEELEIEIAMEVYEALRTPATPKNSSKTTTSSNELPIHFACKNVTSQTLSTISLLAKCCPETCRTATSSKKGNANGGDLPIHLFYKNYTFPNGDVLNITEQQVIRSLLVPILSDINSVKCYSSDGYILPIHIACDLGCDSYIIKELCKTYPNGCSYQMKECYDQETDQTEEDSYDDGYPYTIELYIESSIGIQAREIHYNLLLNNNNNKLSEHDKIKYIQQYNQYLQISDLLFAYYPMAIPADKINNISYRKDPIRLNRLERLIRMEASSSSSSSTNKKNKSLSITASLIWNFFCYYNNPNNNDKDNYNANIGRIISGLDSSSLFKLSFIHDNNNNALLENEDDNNHGTMITLQNGNTIIKEAERRIPTTTFTNIMHDKSPKTEKNITNFKWFFYEILQFLNGIDGIHASMCCKLTMKHGIKSLLEIEGVVKKGVFEIPSSLRYNNNNNIGLLNTIDEHTNSNSIDNDDYYNNNNNNDIIDDEQQQPQPWQRIELVVNDCTHSFQVSYNVEEGFGGGILVVRNDGEYVKPTINQPPWGDAVVAWPPPIDNNNNHNHCNSSTTTTTNDNNPKNVVLHITHTPGRSYGLWYYFPKHPSKNDYSLILSNVKIRQFLYCTDRNGRSPIHCLLQKKLNQSPVVHKLCDRVSLLLKSNFGPKFYTMLQNNINNNNMDSNTKLNADKDAHVTTDSAMANKSVSTSNLIQLALKSGADEATLSLLVSSSPSSLLDCDKDRRTPLHSAFLISKHPPSASIIKTLLVTPGENALKVKDATGRLPIHIAAERCVPTDILLLLIVLYPDGCYRTNKDDDLPIHLLVRSNSNDNNNNTNNNIQASIELLLRQIMKNLSMCKSMGSISRMLPLHIACQYCVSTDIIQTLLKTYPTSASITNQQGLYPIEILELHRKKILIIARLEKRAAAAAALDPDNNNDEERSTSNNDAAASISTTSQSLLTDFESPTDNELIKSFLPNNINYTTLDDINTKTDWVFVYYPSIPLDKLDANTIPYRLDSIRVSRLSKMVKRELILQQQQEQQLEHQQQLQQQQQQQAPQSQSLVPNKTTVYQLSLLAKLCWVFLTTTPYSSSEEDLFYEEFDDDSYVRYHQSGKSGNVSNDAYANVVSGILQGLNVDVVRFLARLHDSHQREIQDVATPTCRYLILSKLRFIRKYELESVYHRGNNCLLIQALDFSLEMEFEKLKTFCNKSMQDYDVSTKTITTTNPTTNSATTSAATYGLPWELFCKFAAKLGVNEKTAEKFFQRYDAIQNSTHVQQNLDINQLLHEESSEDESLTTQATLQSIIEEEDDDDTTFNHGINDDIFHNVDDYYTNSLQDSNSLTPSLQSQQHQLPYRSKRFIDLSMFEEFCKGFGMNTDNGSRKVFFKFFTHRHHFLRECRARQLLKSSNFVDWFSVPILQDYDLDRHTISTTTTNKTTDTANIGDNNDDYGNTSRKRKDELFLNEILEKREGHLLNLSKFRHAIVLPQADCDLRQIFMHEKPSITQTRHYMLQIGKALKKLHHRRIVHGNISMGNIVQFNNRLSLIDLDSMYKIPKGDSPDNGKHPDESMGGATHCWSSGLLPPEMIVKICPTTQSEDLENYESYWKNISEDAKDLKLLTPDDVQIISSVVKSLLTKFSDSSNAVNPTVDSTNAYTYSPHSVPKSGSSQTSLTSSELHLKNTSGEAPRYHTNNQKQHTTQPSAPKNNILNLPPGTTNLSSTQWIGLQDMGLHPEESNKEWKDMLSVALITISFDDLPYSLTSCKTIKDFSEVWNKLLYNAALWDKIRPRLNTLDGHVYVVRTFQEKSNNDLTMLPYSPLVVSQKIDMWGFGVLAFAMCSGCNLFSVDRYENLTDAATFAQLYDWDKRVAKEIIREKVEDPLAQDLLLQILVQEEGRPSSMEKILKHPFFGLSSGGKEAQKILEKYEEQQLMLEETTVITKMTTETRRILDCSCEKQSKIVFEEEIIVVPTCLLMLPYQLRPDSGEERPVLASVANNLDIAVEIGKHFLDINKSTAKLSFWLMMKKKMTGKEGKVFKAQLKDWLKRARSEPCDVVANEIVKAIGCGNEYSKLCREILEREENVSQAKAYVRDPMSTARHAVRDSKESLIKCFSAQFHYLYVVDESNCIPKLPDAHSGHFVEEDSESEIVYPIQIDPNTRHLQLLFFPFINITVMKAIAMNGLSGLTKLLGIPKSYGIPSSWNDTIPGLIHRRKSPSTVAEFAVLLDVVSKQDKQAASSWNLLGNYPQEISTRTGISVWSETSTLAEGDNQINALEFFFREYDPMRDFAGLRRLADTSNNNTAIWTSTQMIQQIQSEVELASVETKLRDLYKELASKENIKQEIIKCKKEVKRFTNGGGSSNDNNHIHGRDRNVMHVQEEELTPKSPARREPARRDREHEMLVPFPDKSNDPIHDVLNSQPHHSKDRSQPKRRIPRPFGSCFEK